MSLGNLSREYESMRMRARMAEDHAQELQDLIYVWFRGKRTVELHQFLITTAEIHQPEYASRKERGQAAA